MLQKLQKNRSGFTLVEIMIVVAIIALLAAIAVPGFIRARKRSQATRILEDLRMIDAAIDQYAVETNKKSNDTVSRNDIKGYLKPNSQLYTTWTNVIGKGYDNEYFVDQTVNTPAGTGTELGDVAPADFWLPYNLVP